MANNALTKNTKHLIKALYESGVKNFVVSPGSRTTPVALLLAEYDRQNDDINLYIDVDERSAGFFALGIAKKQQEPVVLLGTSGTAITEYTSAVAEAHISHVPLIVLSTDRPSELQGNGAPQTLTQHQIFGEFTKNYVSFTLQDEHPDVTTYIDFMTQKLVHESKIAPRGPLQINLPLRKPLMPQLGDKEDIVVSSLTFAQPLKTIDMLKLSQTRVLILAGPNEDADYLPELTEFSNRYHVPVIADVLSRVRTQKTVYGIDALLKSGMITPNYRPELVIRFGATPVSASVLQWLKSENIPVWYVGLTAGSDHSRHTTRVFQISPNEFLSQTTVTNNLEFYQLWQELNAKSRQVTGEASISRTLDNILPEQTTIFVANSMAIRDMDDIFTGKLTQNIYANRGANGIDGIVSTALGMSSTSSQRSVLLIGDLTLFHDMNGLMMAKQYQLPLDIVVVNNNGGGIFSFLPQATAELYFETLFGTPLNLNMAKVASLYDMPYVKINQAQDLKTVIVAPIDGPRLIEFKSDRLSNVKAHHQLMGSNK
ncbi:2-succinyl-5-enolpyruvyl-6-hydroxy-3-cyclohexene-1-carboxylic-acid synthase [Leuconostoc rapi]|uniref:2-succinyl-5-enolpyruvyl-6-hydroxy-3- cyclohexene-1-carboxylic-acid synthase n=1 Tax=Leuconostoc rapi TaxID=1406906 RepID=UPI00195A2B13|nr:2-succinyl-5-enolpyruvyl-6-hydroxy-3-cyclohexene-1-carboxylic-acid synthase [Leuconostoc rapi]MBM7435029.1 2-succinyl-5-enolpyruvyl-6-hydroxy-3-cyclohexene-1-carboxylate synthase [Leuconostoc rapi]